MTRLAAGGRAPRPGLPGILRQHAQRVLQLLAELGAFTDDYPDAGQDTP